MKESWKPLPRNNNYLISNLGNIKNKKGKLLKPQLRLNKSGRKYGYYHISLGRSSKPTLHSLVAETFIGDRPKGAVIRHLNGLKTDNRACNLAYGTIDDNNKDQSLHGVSTRGEMHPMAKLTFEQAKDIRNKYKTGNTSTYKLAKEYGVTASKIYRIIKNRSYVLHKDNSSSLGVHKKAKERRLIESVLV